MKKNKGILSLVVTAILIGVLGFTAAVGWGNDHTGAAKNIKLVLIWRVVSALLIR